ncbi:Ppx/GppA family phosphatase [Cohnella caldifontis]|uniref:Ppx/GppA phosphatase family protein n=1 Tax=Cohnella caldifontis TaxID=3027471 RepID=UPI0023EBE214|nr:Ppx/GppA family phosphatase [Cohnella sp. YIM B05605]
MSLSEVAGMIDIGSNTVRLAVYQYSAGGAYRLIDQGRWSARLSKKLTADGHLPDEAVDELADVLIHYLRICRMHGTRKIRAVATAALRAAKNRDAVIRRLSKATDLRIEVLSGEEEARFGSEAMLRTLNLTEGYVVDIGGGSTEITLLRDRKTLRSVSFPFGCVNTASRFELGDGPVSADRLEEIRREVSRQLDALPWISERPGLPLIGLGGTVRAFAKLRQRETDYPFPLLHGYEQSERELADALDRLADKPAAARGKLPGLSKDRAEVIVPGLAILSAVWRHIGADKLVVCGTGIRDGLFFETCLPGFAQEGGNPVLESSIRNLNALYPTAPSEHLAQVRGLAMAVYRALEAEADLPENAGTWLDAAARLFKIGAAIDLNDNADHTFYMLVHTHWYGLSHRETLLTAAIASYKGAGSLRRRLAPFRSLLREGDAEAAAKLGSILQLAAALDRSESQAIRSLTAAPAPGKLLLKAEAAQSLAVEKKEVEAHAKEFKKIWGRVPVLSEA